MIASGYQEGLVDLRAQHGQRNQTVLGEQGVADRFVVFDLETDGIRGEIIEIGAVLCSGDEVLDTFDSLVRRKLPLEGQTTDLTGLSDGDLVGAPGLADVLARFLAFSDGLPLVAHNGFGFDFPKLDEAARRVGLEIRSQTRLDTLELAHIVLPRAGDGMIRNVDGTTPPKGRRLEQLADWFRLEHGTLHRALNDALLTHRIMMKLLEVLSQDEPARRLQRWILARGKHPWARFSTAEPGEPPDLAEVVPLPRTITRAPPTGKFDIGALQRAFQSGGALMVDREPRPPQADMALTISKALSGGGRHLIEAPTGTGKTLAYLVPAIEYARSSGRTVVISTFTRVLQNQILATLEELGQEIGQFNWTILKGRHNYLRLDSLEAELDEKPPDPSTALALAIICGWVAETPTGDWGDLRTSAINRRLPALALLQWKLRVEDFRGPAFTPLDQRDFYRRAVDGLKNAHIAILNHSLLVSSGKWRMYAQHAVLDEAHQLEEAATAALSKEISRRDLDQMCKAIDHPSGWGTIQRLKRAIRWQALDQGTRSRIRSALDDLSGATTNVAAEMVRFGKVMTEYVRVQTGAQRAEVEQYEISYHIRPGIDPVRSAYRPVIERAIALRTALEQQADTFNQIHVPAELHGRYRRQNLEDELRRLGREARRAARLIDQTVWAEESEVSINICDLRMEDGDWSWKLRRVPASVSQQLSEIWQSLDTVVLTSATLSVCGDFGFLIRTLGIEYAETTARLPSPFDRLRDHHLIIYTDYLPAPRGGLIDEFTKAEAAEIPRLFILTGGRGMALMTARSRLVQVRDHARPYLEDQGLILLAQEDDSAAALVERMNAETNTSLVALRSFWEGVDIPGEALSLLIIEKIPFDSPGDPVVSMRMSLLEERGRDPFADDLVPRATLRFVQGVGRLIRTNEDVGVTVVLDSRLRRPTPYRDRMRNSLIGPPRSADADTAIEAYDLIASQLSIDLDATLRRRIGSIPEADPWLSFLSSAGVHLAEHDLADPDRVRAALEQCREWLGFEGWRPGQLETMVSFMGGRDTVAVLPTGSGKSLTFQLPALISPGVTLVVSPLIALMNDQVENLKARGISQVAAIHSGIAQSEQQEILRSAHRGRYKLLYVSPERLWNPMFTGWLRDIEIARVAVDEANCISQWGHSFRPEYSAIPAALRRALGDSSRPVLAVTATATEQVRQEVEHLLALQISGQPITGTPDRPEIHYYVEGCKNKKDRNARVVQILEAFRGQSALVYVPTRKDTVRLTGLIRTCGLTVRPYHGGLPTEERLHVEDAFRHGEIDVVVATKAFGMGIDKPDIALIVHLEMPASIEEYVQETGRVARGATVGIGPDTGTAVLLVTPRDCRIHKFFVDNCTPDLTTVRELWRAITTGTRYFPIDRSSDATWANAGRFDTSLAMHYLEQVGVVQRGEDTVWKGRITVVSDTRANVEALQSDDAGLAGRALGLLSAAEAPGNDFYEAERWADHLGRSITKIGADLLELNRRGIIGFAAFEYALSVEHSSHAEPDWAAIETAMEQQVEAARERSEQAKRFRSDRAICRRRLMLEYLGAPVPTGPCDGCDRCKDLPRPWRGSELTHDALVDAIPARRITLRLISDTSHRHLSENKLIRALLGDGGGKYPLHAEVRSHPCYGRLEMLGTERARESLEKLVAEGLISRQRREFNSTSYETLVVTDEGREELGRMG